MKKEVQGLASFPGRDSIHRQIYEDSRQYRSLDFFEGVKP